MFYCELISGIWVGDIDLLTNQNFLKDNNISIIINCTQMYDFPNIKNIQKIRIPFSPVRESNTDISLLREKKEKLLNIISTYNDTNNILICCYNGKSISPFIVALYIQKYSKLDDKNIYDVLLTKEKSLELWCDLSVFS